MLSGNFVAPSVSLSAATAVIDVPPIFKFSPIAVVLYTIPAPSTVLPPAIAWNEILSPSFVRVIDVKPATVLETPAVSAYTAQIVVCAFIVSLSGFA